LIACNITEIYIDTQISSTTQSSGKIFSIL